MKIKVLYFGGLREKIGRDADAFDVAEGTTAASLLDSMRRHHVTADFKGLLVAVNEEHSPMSQMLRENDEVALMPPLSGG